MKEEEKEDDSEEEEEEEEKKEEDEVLASYSENDGRELRNGLQPFFDGKSKATNRRIPTSTNDAILLNINS